MIDPPNITLRLIPHWNHAPSFRLIPRWIKLWIALLILNTLNYAFPAPADCMNASCPVTPADLPTPLIFVTGGVVSSLGKGIAAASLAAILEARGLKVTRISMSIRAR